MARALRLSVVCLALLGSVARAEDEAPYAPPDFMTALPPLPASVDRERGVAARSRRGAADRDPPEPRRRARARVGADRAPRHRLSSAVTSSRCCRCRYDHGRSDTPPVTVQEGDAGQILKFVTDDWHLSLGQQLSTGMKLSLDFINGRALSSAGTAVEPLNYRSTCTLSVTQPLLRGFSTDLVLPRVEILRARDRVGARAQAARGHRRRRRRADRGRVLGRRPGAVSLRLASALAAARRRTAGADPAPDRGRPDAAVGSDLGREHARAAQAPARAGGGGDRAGMRTCCARCSTCRAISGRGRSCPSICRRSPPRPARPRTRSRSRSRTGPSSRSSISISRPRCSRCARPRTTSCRRSISGSPAR